MDSTELSQFNRKIFSAKILAIGLMLSAVFALFLAGSQKKYEATIVVFVNAKSEAAAVQQETITNNLANFPKLLSFYDRMLKDNPDVRDVSAGKSQFERKNEWNKMLSVRRQKNSSMIAVSVSAKNKTDAESLVKKTCRTLFDVAGKYYDIKNDVDLRIVDGPITRSAVTGWFCIIPLSLLLGFALAFLLEHFWDMGKNISLSQETKEKLTFDFDLSKFFQKKTDQKIESLEDLYMPEEISEKPYFSENHNKVEIPSEKASQIKEMKSITKIIQQNKYPNFPEMPVHEMKKSEAPDNLPVAEDFPMQSFESQEKPRIETHREPTAEELRERLNRLLRGEL